ncbi:unnamed protein product, partial [marine sediment metagenome]
EFMPSHKHLHSTLKSIKPGFKEKKNKGETLWQ